jgi:hypothetical protein
VAVDASLTATDGHRLFERRFSAEAAIADDDPRSLVHAIGVALDDVSAQVARSVAEALKDGARSADLTGLTGNGWVPRRRSL